MTSTTNAATPPAKKSLSFENQVFQPRYVASWIGFTLSAGVVNAGAVLACDTVVTHVTGNVTQVYLDKDVGSALVFIVAAFIGGAMISALVRETLASRPRVAFVTPIGLAAFILLGVSFAGSHGFFGVFGQAHEVTNRTFLMLGLLAAAMGMVNAGVAGVTANQVRTTHFSGPATDLAGNVIRGILGTGKGHGVELRWAALRLTMLCTFGSGAFVASKIAHGAQFGVFAVAAGTLLTSLLLTLAPERSIELREDESSKRLPEAPVSEPETPSHAPDSLQRGR